jgi:small-conductance mechanosensitive channel
MSLFLFWFFCWQSTAEAVMIRPFSQSSKDKEPLPSSDIDTEHKRQDPRRFLEKIPHLLVAGAFGAGMDPLLDRFFNSSELKYEKGSYKATLVYGTLESVDLGAKAYVITLLMDCLQTLVPPLQKMSPFRANLFEAAPTVGLTVWAAKSLSSIKSLFLHKMVHGRRLGKTAFFDRSLDLLLSLGTVYNMLNHLKVDVGVGFQSLFAASGFSAIIFTLASKGMVEQMVSGLLLEAWDAIDVGDDVRLADGTEGRVQYIGLLETELIGKDHVPVRVPNSQIVGRKIHMFSKVTKNQIKQILRFKYSTLQQLPDIIQDIKKAVTLAAAGQGMINAPSVVLSQYEADHIQVVVSINFEIDATNAPTMAFAQVKEKVLFAIADAVTKNNVSFAIPAIQYETASGATPLSG